MIKYKYYKGEEKSPFPEDDVRSKFWWGERMFSRLPNPEKTLHGYEEDAAEWKKRLMEQQPNQAANLLKNNTDQQLCIAFYTILLFGKFDPYDNQEWIFEY